jgi:3-deoxy-D-arabino-heptulosonate 7-phosphate (DAHP) synthase
MVVALRDVRVRGEIHTIIDYAADMLQVSAVNASDLELLARTDCTRGPQAPDSSSSSSSSG